MAISHGQRGQSPRARSKLRSLLLAGKSSPFERPRWQLLNPRRPEGESKLVLEVGFVSTGPSGAIVTTLADYFSHSRRDRLKRCTTCQQWFVDLTRNKSALRCSRSCTIAWSNAQRPRRGKTRGDTTSKLPVISEPKDSTPAEPSKPATKLRIKDVTAQHLGEGRILFLDPVKPTTK
jgi:hypothetical protein